MKLEKPINSNYCATIVNLPATRFSLVGLDNLEGVNIFGFNVLVSKDSPSELGVFFPTETKLSDKFCYENNLYREDSRTGNLNKDKTQKGYLESKGRIRAISFKGNISNGLFMPLSSLNFTGININELKEGNEFDSLNGIEICRKYVIPHKEGRLIVKVDRGFQRAEKKFIPEHIDTENFFRNSHLIKDTDEVIVTQKLHGTSIRIANTYVNHKPTFVEKISSFFGASIVKTEYAYLYGSRKVIKDANNPNQNHFYESDIWTNEGKKLDGIIPENYIVYGELIGWTTDGKEIQKDYTYNIPVGNCELYIYRIAIINSKGLLTDLSWLQIKEFCNKNGLKYVPEIINTSGKKIKKIVVDFLDVRFADEQIGNTLCLGNKDLVDEGVCIRVDGLTPLILKAKSPKFLEHETKILDTEIEDLESSQN